MINLVTVGAGGFRKRKGRKQDIHRQGPNGTARGELSIKIGQAFAMICVTRQNKIFTARGQRARGSKNCAIYDKI